MCGFVGFYKRNNSKFNIQRNDIYRSLRKIKHRGPDASGTFISENEGIALGHNRLSIQDLSKEANQPMYTEGKKEIIVFNGEIYNFKEIKKELIKKKVSKWRTNSDTEVILNQYTFSRNNNINIDDFLKKFNGIFSLAIWDSINKELIIAKDALGVKPLYYSQTNDGFYFSSEIKALPELGLKLNLINPESINNYLSYIWCPGKNTPEAKVFKVEPGEVIKVKNGAIISRHFWHKTYKTQKSSRKFINENDLISETSNIIRKAVQRQLISDVPIGAFLSGGLDSSTIVKFAKEIKPKINCFTIKNIKRSSSNSEGFVEDYRYAVEVSKHLNVPLHTLEVRENNLINSIENMVYQLDEPLADPASLNVYLISNLARQKGFKVLLSGTGGDDIFSGYRRHIAIKNEQYWSWLPYPTRYLLSKLTKKLPQNYSYYRRISKLFSGLHLNPEDRLINYFRWINQNDLNLLYTEDFKSKLNNLPNKNPMKEYLRKFPSKVSRFEQMLALEQRFFLGDHNLIYTDKMSMQTGVEVRVPFLDIDLVEFVNDLPSKVKTKGLTTKWLLKKVMEKHLPKHIVYRPKTGFGVPLRDWFKNDLRDWTKETLSKDNLSKYNIFDHEQVSRMIDYNDKGIKDTSYTILSIICIEIWLKKFFN